MHAGKKIGYALVVLLTLSIALMVVFPPVLCAGERERVAVLPFHVSGALDHPKGTDLQEMFAAMMASDGIPVIATETVNREPLMRRSDPETEDLHALGTVLGARWVLSGNLQQLGRKMRLELKLLDAAGGERIKTWVFEDEQEKLGFLVEEGIGSVSNHIAGLSPILGIRVAGNRRIEAEAILSVIQSKVGERFNQEKLDEDLRSIHRMGFFREVYMKIEAGEGGKFFIIEVLEKPAIAGIQFRGNRHVGDIDLKDAVGIKPNTIVNLNEIKQGGNRLRDLYKKKGYYGVEVEERLEDLPENRTDLIFEIDEGEKIYISRIHFEGNTRFPDGDLKGLMETREKNLFSRILKSGLLDKEKLEFDLQKITAFYHDKGYIEAKVSEPDIRQEAGKGLVVTIPLFEGERYKVNRVQVESGGEDEGIEEPGKPLPKVHAGEQQYFNRETVHKDVAALRDFYADEGYANADVLPKIREDAQSHLVDITYSIQKGKKVRIGRINITGNVATRDKVIRREMALQEGSYFSATALRKSIENLQRLGYFEDVQIEPRKKSNDFM